MTKHHMRTGGIEKSAAHHEKHNSHHRKANEKSLKSQGDGYGDPEHFTPMHEFEEDVHSGNHAESMCHGGKA